MSDIPQGYIAHPTFDGTQLVGVRPIEFDVSAEQGIIVQRLATGRYRKTAHFVSSGLPDIQVVHRWRIDYSRLVEYLTLIDWIISRPGILTFCNWKYVSVTWTVTLDQVEFKLPWRVAVAGVVSSLIPFPTEDLSASKLQPTITTDPFDKLQNFTIEQKTTVDYDLSSPIVGEAFLDQEGSRFKVGDSLTEGSVMYASIVPLHNVLVSSEPQRRLVVGREGRVLTVQEV